MQNIANFAWVENNIGMRSHKTAKLANVSASYWSDACAASRLTPLLPEEQRAEEKKTQHSSWLLLLAPETNHNMSRTWCEIWCVICTIMCHKTHKGFLVKTFWRWIIGPRSRITMEGRCCQHSMHEKSIREADNYTRWNQWAIIFSCWNGPCKAMRFHGK